MYMFSFSVAYTIIRFRSSIFIHSGSFIRSKFTWRSCIRQRKYTNELCIPICIDEVLPFGENKMLVASRSSALVVRCLQRPVRVNSGLSNVFAYTASRISRRRRQTEIDKLTNEVRRNVYVGIRMHAQLRSQSYIVNALLLCTSH
jgi:hypothetical protein